MAGADRRVLRTTYYLFAQVQLVCVLNTMALITAFSLCPQILDFDDRFPQAVATRGKLHRLCVVC